jgi:hypothetical protein
MLGTAAASQDREGLKTNVGSRSARLDSRRGLFAKYAGAAAAAAAANGMAAAEDLLHQNEI